MPGHEDEVKKPISRRTPKRTRRRATVDDGQRAATGGSDSNGKGDMADSPDLLNKVLGWIEVSGFGLANRDRAIPILISTIISLALFSVVYLAGSPSELRELRAYVDGKTDQLRSAIAEKNAKQDDDISSLFSVLNYSPDGFWVNEIKFGAEGQSRKIHLPLPMKYASASLMAPSVKIAIFPDDPTVAGLLKDSLYYRINSDIPAEVGGVRIGSTDEWVSARRYFEPLAATLPDPWYGVFFEDGDYQSIEFIIHSDAPPEEVAKLFNKPISVLVIVRRGLHSDREATEPPQDLY